MQKTNDVMKNMIDMQSTVGYTDFTDASKFLGTPQMWCYKQYKENRLTMIDGKYIGVKTMAGSPVSIDALLGNTDIDFYPTMFGIYIPSEQILTRTKYQWFPRMSVNQILQSNLLIASYALGSY